MRDSPELHWSTQAGTSSSVRDPYPARGLILHRRPLSGLPPHFHGERRIKRWGIAAGTAIGAALGTKSNAKAERKCQNFALVTTLFSGSASPRRVGRGSSQYLAAAKSVATHFLPLCATLARGRERHHLSRVRRSHTLSAPFCGIEPSELCQQFRVAIPLDALRHHGEEVIA